MKIKKILIVDEGTGFGGSLIVAARLADSLDGEKFEPIIVTAMDINIARNHISPDIQTIQLKKTFSYVKRDKITSLIESVKFKPLFILLIIVLTLFENLVNISYLLKLIFYIYKFKIDLIHVNNSKDALIAAKLTRRPCIQHLHGWETPPDSKSARFYYKLPDAFIAISNTVKNAVVSGGADSNKITVIYNPIATKNLLTTEERNSLRLKLRFNNDMITIAIFGRIIGWKGQLQFLKALKILHDKDFKFNILIVGDDGEGYDEEYSKSVKSFSKEHFSHSNIVYTGYVGNPEHYYQVCDLVIHASIKPEPFGLVITEAMQYSVPVIVSSIGAGEELIDNHVTGLISNPKDIENLANCIEFLIKNPEERTRLAINGQKFVEENMNPSDFAIKVASIYLKLIP